MEAFTFYIRQGQLLAGFPGIRPDWEMLRITACLVQVHVKYREGITVSQSRGAGQRTAIQSGGCVAT